MWMTPADERARGPASAGDAERRRTAALVHRARRGDHGAFTALWERYAATVRSVVAGQLPSPQADDVVQDVALLALSKLHTLRDGRGFLAWLCTIARNRARNVRKSNRQLEQSGDMDALPATDSGDAGTDAALAALRALPETYRQPLVLRFLHGLSGQEIAARLGMTHGSVRVNLCRGLKLLRERARRRR
jgi:RNA polymerase sigma-70 factor (ECF subfamily)